jgi:hypothetical protein
MIIKTVSFPQISGTTEIRYFIGKTAKENFDLIDAAVGHHIWFHINGQPSGHVIAEVPNDIEKKDLRYIIKQGCVICKQMSKFASQKRVDIIYAKVEHVEKQDRVGSVIVSNGKTITI